MSAIVASTDTQRLRFEPITAANWRAAVRLRIHPEQRHFVPSVAATLAEVWLHRDERRCDPFGIRLGHHMLGFLIASFTVEQLETCHLGGFLIDHRFQGRGLGRQALRDFLTLAMSRYPGCTRILLNVHPQNTAATALYRSIGFRRLVGEECEGTEYPVLQYHLKRPDPVVARIPEVCHDTV